MITCSLHRHNNFCRCRSNLHRFSPDISPLGRKVAGYSPECSPHWASPWRRPSWQSCRTARPQAGGRARWSPPPPGPRSCGASWSSAGAGGRGRRWRCDWGDEGQKQDRTGAISFFTEAEVKVVAAQLSSVDSPVRDPHQHLQARELQLLDLLCCTDWGWGEGGQ